MSAEEQNQTRNDAEAALRESEANLAAVRLKLELAARSMEQAAHGIREYLESPGHILLSYKTSTTGGAPTLAFAYSDEPTSCGTGGGVDQSTGDTLGACTGGNGGTPACDCYAPGSNGGGSFAAANWGGHGGGCWQSGNGPAATNTSTVGDGDVHVFFGCGNGGFQAFNGSSQDAGNNNGNTIMDFRLTTSGYDSDSNGAFQTFTNNTPASQNSNSWGVGPSMPKECQCSGPPTSCSRCIYSVQAFNGNDWDQSTGGVALFTDPSGHPLGVTINKAGYGTLFTPGELCGSTTGDNPCVNFQSGDPYVWTFGASSTLCAGVASTCDRVSSMAVYDNQGTGSGHSTYLIYWPNNERLTSVALSNNSAAINGYGTLVSDSSNQLALDLVGTCALDKDCLTEQVVAGDTLSINGCSCTGSICPPVITSVVTVNTTISYLTINVPVTTAFSGCNFGTGLGFTYTGFFVHPAHDYAPQVPNTGYPGGAVTVSANCTSPPCTNAIIWGLEPSSDSQDGMDRGFGKIYAYAALPNNDDNLTLEWNSTDPWCASEFVRPTVVNGNVFAATYADSCPSGAGCKRTQTISSCKYSSLNTGGPYPSGIRWYH